jgi:hypothetical protein
MSALRAVLQRDSDSSSSEQPPRRVLDSKVHDSVVDLLRGSRSRKEFVMGDL